MRLDVSRGCGHGPGPKIATFECLREFKSRINDPELYEEVNLIAYVESLATEIDYQENFTEPLDLPFKRTAFERLGAPCFELGNREDDEAIKYEIWSLIVTEIAPNDYHFIAFAVDPRQNQVFLIDSNDEKNIIGTFKCMVKFLVGELNKKTVKKGSIKTNERLKFKNRNGEKVIRKIKNVIYIGGSAKSNRETERFFEVDWSYRWEVRGHWRELKPTSIGKDRDGNYNVVGHTWVSDFVKGPEDKPLMKKTRVVSNENNIENR